MLNSPWKAWFGLGWGALKLSAATFTSLCSQTSSQEMKLSEAPARNGRPKESWAASKAMEVQWHQHSDISSWLFQHIQASRGSGASTHWLFMAPPLGTRLCERPTASAGSKTQTGSFCAEGFAFQAWAVTVSFSQSFCGEQNWNSALWPLALSRLTAGHQPLCISHTSSATWNPFLLLAPPEKLKISLFCCIPFPSVGIMLSSLLKCCKGWRWKTPSDEGVF